MLQFIWSKGVQLSFTTNVEQYFIDILFGVLIQVYDIHQADACKVTPAKFCGSKEVVPLHFRKVVSPFFSLHSSI